MTSPEILHPAVRAAVEALGIPYEALACEDNLADTAAFCAHYGIPPHEACNAIIVSVKTTPRRFVACLVRADTRLDVNHKLADLVGTRRLSFASSEETLELTGQLIGGVTVFALPPDVPLYLDVRVKERDRIIVGGGNRTSKIRIAPAVLEKIPSATFADIANPR